MDKLNPTHPLSHFPFPEKCLLNFRLEQIHKMNPLTKSDYKFPSEMELLNFKDFCPTLHSEGD